MKKKHFRTIWHPIFYTLIKRTRPRGYKVEYEVPLGTLPPRADLLMLQKVGQKVGRIRELPALYTRLGEHTVLEYKGATTCCEVQDLNVLLGYGSLYMAQKKLESDRVVLMLLANRLEARVREGLWRRGAGLEEEEAGVWRGQLAGVRFYFYELERVWHGEEANHLFWVATRALLEEGFEPKRLTKRTAALYYELGHALKGPAHYGEEDMEAQEQVKRNLGRGLQKVLEKFAPAERVAGLTPQERLAGLAPQERLAGLAPQERLAGLDSEAKRALLKALQDELDDARI